MATAWRERSTYAQFIRILSVTLVSVPLDLLSYELVFVVSPIGLLVVIGPTAPIAVAPAQRRRFLWLIDGGLVAFGYVVVGRIPDILPSGVF